MIIPAEKKHIEELALVIRQGNRDVAGKFGLNIKNAPKHPSFCTSDWVISDIDRGQSYFLYKEHHTVKGCVAFEQADSTTAYLNRLSVLPQFRCQGIGYKLTRHIINLAKSKGINTISIGIIGEHLDLRDWYLNRGFYLTKTSTFAHLPFTVQYLQYDL